MDATTRWETEAMRSSPQKRSKPPRPTAKRQPYEPGSGTFITLKEAEDATGIPANTLRKWVRKDAITSYLESDGETTLRMVELGSVKHRAQELGRQIKKTVPPSGGTGESASQGDARASEPRPPSPTPEPPDTPEGSMLVPIDAWNKMLNQLGNLHEAGQQLAEARERAAKAETEALFLRERLAEVRSQNSEVRRRTSDVGRQTSETGSDPTPSVPQPGQASEASQGGPRADETSDQPTTSYWRYLTTGWRSRKKNR